MQYYKTSNPAESCGHEWEFLFVTLTITLPLAVKWHTSNLNYT